MMSSVDVVGYVISPFRLRFGWKGWLRGAKCQLARSAELSGHRESGCSKRTVQGSAVGALCQAGQRSGGERWRDVPGNKVGRESRSYSGGFLSV